MIIFIHRREIFVTVQNKCSKFPPSTSIHSETRVRHSRVVALSLAACCLCGQQHLKCGQAIHLVCPPFFCKLRSSSNPREKKFKVVRSGDFGGRWIGPRRPMHGPGKAELRYYINGRVQGLQYRDPRIPNTEMTVKFFPVFKYRYSCKIPVFSTNLKK